MASVTQSKKGIRIEKPVDVLALEQKELVSMTGSVGFVFKSMLLMAYVFAAICLFLVFKVS